MKSALRIGSTVYNFEGKGLADVALSFYKGLADLLSEHGRLRVAVLVRDVDDERVVRRFFLEPRDLTLDISGDGIESVEPNAEILEQIQKDFAEHGGVAIGDLQEALDALVSGDVS